MFSKNLLPVFKLKVSHLIDQNRNLGMEKWISGVLCLLLFQRIRVGFPAPTSGNSQLPTIQLQRIWLSLLASLGTYTRMIVPIHAHTHTYICTYIHKYTHTFTYAYIHTYKQIKHLNAWNYTYCYFMWCFEICKVSHRDTHTYTHTHEDSVCCFTP